MFKASKIVAGKKLVAVFLILYITCNVTHARPSESFGKSGAIDLETPADPNLYNGDLTPEVIRQIQKCDKDIETMELCMRCAKVTKSEIVYPMCCDNEEDVKDWCRAYIYYGASPSTS